MRRLIAWNVMSLDGCFEGASAWDLDFHGSVWGEELEEFSLKQGAEIGTLLFGRKTYEGMARYWTGESEPGPVKDLMNSVEKAVASRGLSHAAWHNTRLLQGEAVETVRGLKAELGNDVYVFGSAELLSSLLAAGLVDEYRICLAPLLLGTGRPLFAAGAKRQAWSLVECRALKSGGVILRYVRA